MEHDRTSPVLERIADALGVRTSAFVQHSSCGEGTRFQDVCQEAEMLRLFATITDPARRLSCLEYLRAAAKAARAG